MKPALLEWSHFSKTTQGKYCLVHKHRAKRTNIPLARHRLSPLRPSLLSNIFLAWHEHLILKPAGGS